MTTIISKNQFLNDTESWYFVNVSGGNGKITSRWQKQRDTRKGSYKGGWNYKSAGGMLSCSANKGATASDNYWERLLNFESVGVTPGETVISIKANYVYQFRCCLVHGGANTMRNSQVELAVGDAKVGPLELYDIDDNLIDTFSSAIDCPERNSLIGMWPRYPIGTNQYPLQEIPDAHAEVVGTPITINLPSNTTVKLRLNNHLPVIHNDIRNWLCLRNDHIVITLITSGGSVITVGGTNPFYLLKRR